METREDLENEFNAYLREIQDVNGIDINGIDIAPQIKSLWLQINDVVNNQNAINSWRDTYKKLLDIRPQI